MLDYYVEFFNKVARKGHNENVVKSQRRLEEEDRKTRFERGTFRSDGVKFRADTTTIAEHLGMRQKTVWAFIDRLVKYLEGDKSKEIVKERVDYENYDLDLTSVIHLWYKGVDKKRQDKYLELFWLFAGTGRMIEADQQPGVEDVIDYLLFKTHNYARPPEHFYNFSSFGPSDEF